MPLREGAYDEQSPPRGGRLLGLYLGALLPKEAEMGKKKSKQDKSKQPEALENSDAKPKESSKSKSASSEPKTLDKKFYEKELGRLQIELVKLQEPLPR